MTSEAELKNPKVISMTKDQIFPLEDDSIRAGYIDKNVLNDC